MAKRISLCQRRFRVRFPFRGPICQGLRKEPGLGIIPGCSIEAACVAGRAQVRRQPPGPEEKARPVYTRIGISFCIVFVWVEKPQKQKGRML